jgi:glycosyltransferase involved in cell wall biosynthesis
VIPVSVDAQHVLHGDPEVARTKYGLGFHPILLSLGHVVALRNRMALIEALPLILRSYPDLKTVVVGDLRETNFLERADELGVAHALVCLGSVPHSMMKHLLACASVEAHDLQGLGLGITTVEAMCASVPIVAVATDDNYPGVSLRSFEGISFLAENKPSTIARSVITLLDDPAARKHAVAAQHRLVSELFTPSKATAKYLQALQSAVEDESRSSI